MSVFTIEVIGAAWPDMSHNCYYVKYDLVIPECIDRGVPPG